MKRGHVSLQPLPEQTLLGKRSTPGTRWISPWIEIFAGQGVDPMHPVTVGILWLWDRARNREGHEVWLGLWAITGLQLQKLGATWVLVRAIEEGSVLIHCVVCALQWIRCAGTVSAPQGSCFSLRERGWYYVQASQHDHTLSPTDNGGNLPCSTWMSLWTLTPSLSCGESSQAPPRAYLYIASEGEAITLSHRGIFQRTKPSMEISISVFSQMHKNNSQNTSNTNKEDNNVMLQKENKILQY